MQIISCPTCGSPLLNSGERCAHCGEAAPASEVPLCLKNGHVSQDTPAASHSCGDAASLEWIEAGPTARLPHITACAHGEGVSELPESELTLKLECRTNGVRDETPQELAESTLNLKHMRRGARASLEADILASFEGASEEQDEEAIEGEEERQATWQKVIERKTGHTLPAVALFSPRVSVRKRLLTSLQPVLQRPRAFFWLSAAVLCMLLLAGGFGMALGFGRGTSQARIVPSLSLQASPATIALGGIVTLRGVHFTPGGLATLSRDRHIPVVDTGGANNVQIDAHGLFSDTIVVDPDWLAGPHSLYATDIHTRRQALFNLLVTGQNALQGPPRLLLSSNALDLGAGDEATNSSKVFALSNAGGGELTWQAKTNQSWLQISPESGSILSGSHLSAMVAVDRSGLAPGSYHASILFISNTEQVSLTVHMAVTPLQPKHEAILQVSSAALAFSGSAKGPEPQEQAIVVSNPGARPLSWSASILLQNGLNWLQITPQAGALDPGGQQSILIGVTTQDLTPGVYKGEISFAKQGTQPVQDSPQTVYVSLTITPACVLTFAPGSLSFAGVHGGASPGAQTLAINVARGCTTSQSWSASVHTIGGNWLQLSQARGATPSSPLVSVNTAGLGPGVYTGMLTFAVNTGPQLVPVKLTVNPVPCALSAQSEVALQGTAGQATSNVQSVTVTTSGDCPSALNWTSSIGEGTAWLNATLLGTLTQPGTASVNVQAALTGMSAGTYSGLLTITAVDSATGKVVGTAQISVTLTVVAPPPPCALQTPTASAQSFSTSVGSTTTQSASVTIGATGSCSGDVTVTPVSDSSWLVVGGPVTLASGGTATIPVTIDPTALTANLYTGTITLTAADSNGTIAGSPQSVSITLTVQ